MGQAISMYIVECRLNGEKILNESTDWTKYYQNKKSFFSSYTQKYTVERIIKVIDQYLINETESKILELGGGNSCFAENICQNRSIEQYDIIDNNKLAVGMFNKKILKCNKHVGIEADLTQDSEEKGKYDFVYSVGLIEHFKSSTREKVIDAHFKYAKADGIVMISFPTPTFKYRFWRKTMEILGVWQFWDEYPLTLNDVKTEIEEKGQILEVQVNNKLFLTQMIVVAKRNQGYCNDKKYSNSYSCI